MFTQPTHIPGDWEWSPRLLPPAEKIIANPTQSRPVYGLYCWAHEYLTHRDFIKDTGWRNIRLSGPITDEVMKAFAEDGMEVMLTMPARKPFASPDAPQGKWRNRKNFESDEAFIQDYIQDVGDVLKRYGPKGTFWTESPTVPYSPLLHIEIFNEPNFWYLDTAREDKANHMPPKDEAAREAQNLSRQRLYGKLLSAAYKQIKSQWPAVQVVGFGAGGAVGADVPFIKGVHESNGSVAESYDILSTHPYLRPAPPEGAYVKSFGKISIIDGTRSIREIMRTAGTERCPLWWTELNWTIYPEAGGSFNEAAYRGVSLNRDVTPELQAAYTVRSYALALRLGVARLHFMSLVDTDNVNSGMLDKEGTPRPSAIAVKTMIKAMPHPKLVEVVRENEDGIYVYRFQSNSSQRRSSEVLMAYRVQGPTTISVPWSAPRALLIDMIGNRREISAEANSISLEIGPLPVYLCELPQS